MKTSENPAVPARKLIELSSDWWNEIGVMSAHGDFPFELVGYLRGLVSSCLREMIPPQMTTETLMLMRNCFGNADFRIDGERFEVVLYKPDDPQKNRSFLALRRCYPDGELVRLATLSLEECLS